MGIKSHIFELCTLKCSFNLEGQKLEYLILKFVLGGIFLNMNEFCKKKLLILIKENSLSKAFQKVSWN